VSTWQRADGAVRWLTFLDGPPADMPPPTRLELLLDALDSCIPHWDDALIWGTMLGLLSVLLAAAG
jgi:hypothetical protein